MPWYTSLFQWFSGYVRPQIDLTIAIGSLTVEIQVVFYEDCGHFHRWAAGTCHRISTRKSSQEFNVGPIYKASGKTSFVNVIGSGQVCLISLSCYSCIWIHLGQSGAKKWYRPSGSMYETFARETSRSRFGISLVRRDSLQVPVRPC